MAIDIKMPKFGETMTEGTIFTWFKDQGEHVEKGEPLFEIETDKATLEVEAPSSGILAKIIVGENESTGIGEKVAIITQEDEKISGIEGKRENNKAYSTENIKGSSNKIKATPAARYLAKSEEIDLSNIKRNNNRDVIIKSDIMSHLEREFNEESVKEVKELKLNNIRRKTAENMTKSYKEIPHVTLTTKVSMREIVDLREKLNESIEHHLTFTDIIIMATARSLHDNPLMNSKYFENNIKFYDDINIGLAVDTNDGLIVPNIKNTDQLRLEEIAKKRGDLVSRAKSRKLTKKELQGGTFTITNLGSLEIEIFTPIIKPGESGILGVGKISEQTVVDEGNIKVEPMLWLSLSFDHRVIDGAPAAKFLYQIKEMLEIPAIMLLN